MNTEANVTVSPVGVSRRFIAGSACCRGSPSKFDDAPGGPRLDRVSVVPVPAMVGAAADREQFRTRGSAEKLRWLGYAVLLLVLAIAAIYVGSRVQDITPGAMQFPQPVCFVTSWERMFHPSPFDDLCRN